MVAHHIQAMAAQAPKRVANDSQQVPDRSIGTFRSALSVWSSPRVGISPYSPEQCGVGLHQGDGVGAVDRHPLLSIFKAGQRLVDHVGEIRLSEEDMTRPSETSSRQL